MKSLRSVLRWTRLVLSTQTSSNSQVLANIRFNQLNRIILILLGVFNDTLNRARHHLQEDPGKARKPFKAIGERSLVQSSKHNRYPGMSLACASQ